MKFWTFFKNYRFSRKHEKCSGKTQVYRFLSVSYFRPYPFYRIYRKCKYGISSIFLRMQFLGIKVVWREIWELIKEKWWVQFHTKIFPNFLFYKKVMSCYSKLSSFLLLILQGKFLCGNSSC